MALIAVTAMASAFVVGLCLTKGIKRLEGFERVVFSFVFGTLTWAFASLFASFAFGFGFNTVVITSAVFFATAFILRKGVKVEGIDKTVLLVALLGVIVFLPLLNTHVLQEKPDGLYAGGSTWGDLAFHLALINGFKERGLELEYPVFSGQKLGYHFLFDFYTAEMSEAGLSVRDAIILTSLLFSVAFVLALYAFSLRVSQSKKAAIAALLLVLLAGGFGFVFFAESIVKGQSIAQALSVDYVHLEEKGFSWWSAIGDQLLPQRQGVVGLAALLIGVILLFKAVKERRSNDLAYAGVLAGLLPLFHAPSFVCMGMISALLVLLFRQLLDWKMFFVPFVLLALPQAWWSFSQVTQGFVRFLPFWYNDNPIAFLAKNIGAFMLLAIIGAVLLKEEEKRFFVPVAAVFVITNLIVFQPFATDNMRFLFICVTLSAAFAAKAVAAITLKKKLFSAAIASLFILSILSGSLSLARESSLSWRLYSNEDVSLAEWVKTNTAKDALFLTSARHNNPIPSLAGRKTLLGYQGWLWSHGINYSEREQTVNKMLQGNEEEIRKSGISYAVLEEKDEKTAFDASYQKAKEIGQYVVYKII